MESLPLKSALRPHSSCHQTAEGLPQVGDDLSGSDFFCHVMAEPIRFRDELLVQTPAGSVCALNETGAWLWMTLSHGASLTEAISAFAARFGHSLADIDADVRRIIQKWQNHDLIELVPAEMMPVELLQRPPHLDAIYRIGQEAVRVRCGSSHLAGKIELTFAPSRVDCSDARLNAIDLYKDDTGFVVARNRRVVLRTSDPGYARGALLQQLLRLSWPERQWLACLHGAAIGNGASCLVFSGECGAGKSTLAAALVHAGFAFMADDLVPMECGSHLVWPLPFSMCLKDGGAQIATRFFPEIANIPRETTDRGRVRYFFPADRAHPVSAGGLPVHGLIFPRYRAEAPLSLDPIDQLDALGRLCSNGSSLDLSGHQLRESLSWLEAVPCYALTYSCLDAAVGVLADLWAEA